MIATLFTFLFELFKWSTFSDFLQKLLGVAVCLSICCLQPGCSPNMEPVERTANKGWEVVGKVADKGVNELTSRTAMLQGQLSGINPSYITRGFGGVGTFFVWDAKFGIDGVSGNLAGASQGDAGQSALIKPPASSQPGRE